FQDYRTEYPDSVYLRLLRHIHSSLGSEGASIHDMGVILRPYKNSRKLLRCHGHQVDTNPTSCGYQDGHQGGKSLRAKGLVPKKGLEPPHPCGYMDLNHARLPIPPLRLEVAGRQAIERLHGQRKES